MPTRQLLGLLLCVALLGSGRLVRYHLLTGPDGGWPDELWLDDLLADPAEAQPTRPARPVLTGPLPVNRCATDSLTLLPGVGPVLAGRIAAARAAGLVFRVPADLAVVKGIGPALTARLGPLIDFALPHPAKAVPAQESR